MSAAGLRVLSQAAQTAELWYTVRMAKKRTNLKIPYGRGPKMCTCELVGEKKYE